MKKVLKEILYKNKFYLLIEAVFIVVQIFLLALPSKILGEIINYLYNIELYKNQIYRIIFEEKGVDFSQYKKNTLTRRIERRLAALK